MRYSFFILHFILFFFLTSLPAGAQERLPASMAVGINTPRQLLNQAESDYAVGRIEQAVSTLQDNLDTFQGTLRQSACRLLALCYLSQDQDEEARRWAEQLVNLNRYYNSTDDPARFQDLINQLREDITATITTASNQSESVNEAPAPVTIITAAMIEELGYNRNLNQILAAYVPGIAEITTSNGNTNLAMHGAYAEGQELILIMENGHRLNTRFDNKGPTSYSISTEKIDHIEVLRGPASSLYGNVAVSAVVNIITRSGRSVNGVKAKYGHGSFGTHKADLLVGTQFMDADILAWASIYHSGGQLRPFPDDDPRAQNPMIDEYGIWKSLRYHFNRIYVDGYKDPPAYDVGLKMQLKGFNLLFSKKNVKKVLPFSSNYNGGYDYDRYHLINGMKPGDGEETTHAELGYTHQMGHLYVNGSVYSDWYNYSTYNVQHDSIVYIEPIYDDEGNYVLDENGDPMLGSTSSTGNLTYMQFREHTIGGQLKAGTDYRLAQMKGHLLAGAQYEHFSLLSRNDFYAKDFINISDGSLELSDITDMGKESSLSFFLQDKHYLLPQLILNAGARYDFKYRRKEDVVRSFSPRLALMYVPSDRFSLKLSYSEAFADLSFYFRYIYKPGDDNLVMDPQHLSAVQLTAMGSIPQLHLSYEANLFLNRYTNLLCWQARDYDILLDEAIGNNQGRLTTVGLEGSATYTHNRLSAGLTLYCARDLSSHHYFYNSQEKTVNNVPHLTVNMHGAWKLLRRQDHQLKAYGHATYTGRRLDLSYTEEEDAWLHGNVLLALGLQYRYRQHLQLSLDCENIFNTDHYLCSMDLTNRRYIQRGRTLMAAIAFQF